MKLLVLAQTPPPLHGQSVMVQTLLDGLPARGLAVHHVNLGLSRDTADIGRWRWGKVAALVDACLHAVGARFRHRCDTLYYVPAPAKRSALYRDWLVMLLCRPAFPRLVLHWHAAGLGEWLAMHATAPERWLSGWLLGRADLAIVLGESLRADAAWFSPKKITVVRNGIADPCPGFQRPPPTDPLRRRAVFLSWCTAPKGLFDAIEAVRLANLAPAGPRWELLAAGGFGTGAEREKFAALSAEAGGWLHHEGFVQGADKHALLAGADALVFPTYYSAETQGLVVAEALAYDLPVIVTPWRAVAENLPAAHAHVVAPQAPGEIAAALQRVAETPPPGGAARAHFLAHYRAEVFLDRLAAALSDSARPAASG